MSYNRRIIFHYFLVLADCRRWEIFKGDLQTVLKAQNVHREFEFIRIAFDRSMTYLSNRLQSSKGSRIWIIIHEPLMYWFHKEEGRRAGKWNYTYSLFKIRNACGGKKELPQYAAVQSNTLLSILFVTLLCPWNAVLYEVILFNILIFFNFKMQPVTPM